MVSERMKQSIERGKPMAALFTAKDRLVSRFGPDDVYDFSIGNPNVPAPATVKESIIKQAKELTELELHSYTPVEGYPFVRKAIAEHDREKFGVDLTEKNILMTAGAAGGLNAVMMTLLDEGDEVIVLKPFFGEYAVYVEHAGGELVVVPTEEGTFRIDVKEVERAITRRTKAVLINTPNNPTGVIYSEESLRDLAYVLNEKNNDLGIDITLVSDEPYRDLAYAGARVPYIPKFYDNTIISYSFSKSLSLPGERIGYVTIPDSVTNFSEISAGMVTACRVLFVNAPSLIQRVAAVCIQDECDVEYYARNRDAIYEGLKEIGYECVVPQGAFYLWLKTPIEDDFEFARKAEDYQIVVVPGSAFKGPGYVRVSFCVSHEMILAALPKFKELFDDIRAGR
jgi:aspartate aminotransferase